MGRDGSGNLWSFFFFFFLIGVLFESRVMLLAIAVELEVFHFLLLR